MEDRQHFINQPTIDSLLHKVQQISLLLISTVAIIIVLVCLIIKKKKSQTQSKSTIQQPILQADIRQNIPHQQDTTKKSFKFSLDEPLSPQEEISRAHTEKQLTALLRQDFQQYPSNTQYYSLKQGRLNFLNKLKSQKQQQNIIYLDQDDIKEREQRKQDINQSNLRLKIQQEKLRAEKLAAQVKQTKKQTIKVPEKKPQEKKVQEMKTSLFGEKLSTVDQSKQVQKPTLPQQPLNFANVSLGLPSQNKMTQKQETKSLFQSVQQPKLAEQTAKKEEKASLFSTSQPTGGSLFGQPSAPQTAVQQKPTLFSTAAQQQSLFGQNLPAQTTTEKKQQASVLPKPATQPQPVPPQQSSQSQRPGTQIFAPSSAPSSAPSRINKKDYLQMLIEYSKGAKQHCELKKTKINNFGRSISNFKQLYETSIDFINTINLGDAKEVETLACMIYDFLLNKTIPAWPKQEGWEMFPPRTKNETKWKISITTYVLKLNIYRAMGHENLWLIVFGKLLSLLDFTWKRTNQITQSSSAIKQLDLVKNGYFSLSKQDDMAPKYFTRLDLITYFLFCMTTFDPQMVAEYLCQTAGQDRKTLQEIKKYQYKWSYNYFWILVETILNNQTKTYFKPILYMNILSSMYLQIRRNKLNPNDFRDFDHLRKFILKQAIESTTDSELQRNQQIQTFAEIEQETREFKFDGQDFLGQIETMNFYFKEKDGQYRKATPDNRKGFDEFEKRCSVFDYFKSQIKVG